MKQPVILIILDGFGIAPDSQGNAIALAKTPVTDRLWREVPHTQLSASGEDVGLPAGQMGNSEVGHTNIGAGRVVYQELSRITRAAQNGELEQNPALRQAVEHIRATGGSLHFMGLLSDGGVHSHNTHLYAMIRAAKSLGAEKIYVHAFLDGRDCPPKSGLGFVKELRQELSAIGAGTLATVCGRYYAMDRDNRWDRVAEAYDALTLPPAEIADPEQWVEESYRQEITDEFVKPAACCKGGRISDGDSVMFFNFRPDRARELTRALTQPGFDGFEKKAAPKDLCYVCTTVYDDSFEGVLVAFPPSPLFLSELMILKQTIADGRWWLVTGIMLLLCLVIYFFCSRLLRLCYQPRQDELHPSATDRALSWSALSLLAAAIGLGLWQPAFFRELIDRIASL